MSDESGEGQSPDEGSRIDGFKDRLKDAGQKVSAASKKAAQKTSELGSAIAGSSVAKDIAAGAKKVGEDVKGASAKVSETVDKKREEFKERREAAKVAKAEADDKRELELMESIGSSELIPITNELEESESDEEIRKLTVVQLKSRLANLGLKVSGKKDDLITRLSEAKDSAKTKIESLQSKEEDENLVTHSSTTREDEIQSLVDANQPVQSLKPKLSEASRAIVSRQMNFFLRVGYAGFFALLSMSVAGLFVDEGLLGLILNFAADRLASEYGALNNLETLILRISVAILLSIASLSYLFQRPLLAAICSTCAVVSSLLIRSTIVENVSIADPIIDGLLLIPLTVISFVPWLATRDSENLDLNSEFILSDYNEESSIGLISGGENDSLIEMDQFAVTRPTPPRRRRPMEFFYEGLFLIIALIMWPVTIATHFLLALEIDTRYGNWSIEQNGLTLLLPLYVLSLFASLVVIRSDREARGGPLYAKEKEAYHEFMNQFLALKKAYYERQAKRLNIDDSE